ncbi:MAG: transglutaminase family protein [Bacteroidales bacterium]|jgi:regulator of sirC expression with transglutaminase-like and TPR domain|nr:transglutaminase family protein [Bacteroidales bacterium]
MTNKNSEIKALLQLLDDPNNEIFMQVSQRILIEGEDIIPELERAWETSLNEVLQERIENLIQEIQFTSTQKQLFDWKENNSTNLLQGAFLIAKYQYPDLKFDTIASTFDKIKQDAWLEISENLTALEKVRVLNHIFFEIHGFSGNSTNFFAPQNSFLNHVFESKKGNPLTLGIIYIALAQELDIPIYGVSMPRNFILSYLDIFNTDNPYDDEVLFYINPYNKGTVLGKREIDYFLKQQKMEPKESYYKPCTNIEVIKKLILNLVYSYEKLGYPDKVESMKQLYNIFN